jgi:hypothetical protein
MALVEETKTVYCLISMTMSKRSLVSIRMTSCIFETAVYIGLMRLSPLHSVRGDRSSAGCKMVNKSGEKLKILCRSQCTACRRGPVNLSIEMSSRLRISQWSAIL